MSGGAFDYQQYTISRIADEIEQLIHENGREDKDEYGYPRFHDYPPHVIARFREGVKTLRQAQVYAHRIDWLVSGDDGEDSFLRRLDEELAKLEEPS